MSSETYTVRFEGDEFFNLPDDRKSDDSEVYLEFSVDPLKGLEYEYTMDVVVKMDGKDVVDIKRVNNKVDLKNVIDPSKVAKYCSEKKMNLPDAVHGKDHSAKCMHYFAYHTLLMWALYDLAMTAKSQAVFFPLLQESPNHPDKLRKKMSKADYERHMRSQAESFFTQSGLKTFAYELSPYAMLGVVDEPVALLSAAMARYAASYVDMWSKVFPQGRKMDLEKLGPWYNQVQNFIGSLVAMYLSGNFPQTEDDEDKMDEEKAAKGKYGSGYGYGRSGYSGYSYWPYYRSYWPYWSKCGYRRCGYYGLGYGGSGYPYYSGSYYGYPRYSYGRRYGYRGYGRRGYRRGHFRGGRRGHGGARRRFRSGFGRRGGRRHRGPDDEGTLLFSGMVQVDASGKPAHGAAHGAQHYSGSSDCSTEGECHPLDTDGRSHRVIGPDHKKVPGYARDSILAPDHPIAVPSEAVPHKAHHKATVTEQRRAAFGKDAGKYAANFQPYYCGYNCGVLPYYRAGSSGTALETFAVPHAYHHYKTTKGMLDKRYVTYAEMMEAMKMVMKSMRHLYNRQEAIEEYLKAQMRMDKNELQTLYHHHRRHGRHSKGATEEDDDEVALASLADMDYDVYSDDEDEAELDAWKHFEAGLTSGSTAKGSVTYRVDDTVRVVGPEAANATHMAAGLAAGSAPKPHPSGPTPTPHPSGPTPKPHPSGPVTRAEFNQLSDQVHTLTSKVNSLLQFMNVN